MISYPSGDHDLLFSRLGISRDARILDVGGGHNPFKYAHVIVDRDFNSGNKHRDGGRALFSGPGKLFIQADIHNLPFEDNSFDFVICMQVLEHVEFPDRACDELMRVARNGFIETPRKWTEYYAGHPAHCWLIDEQDGRIIFEPITYTDSPFMNFALTSLWNSQELQERLFIDYSNIPCVQLLWNTCFEYQVKGGLPDRVKKDAFLAESHYCFSRNILFWMGRLETGAFHAGMAHQLMPESEKYQKMSFFYAVLTGRIKDIRSQKFELKLFMGAMMCRLIRFLYQKLFALHRWTMGKLQGPLI